MVSRDEENEAGQPGMAMYVATYTIVSMVDQ